MNNSLLFSFCLIATASIGTVLAQTSTDQTGEIAAASSSSPVAFVYVSRPTHIDGFAVSSDGKLTPVPGSPFSGISVRHMSVTKKFLFGVGDDFQTIYSFSIASDGALKQVGSIDALKYAYGNTGCCFGPLVIDYSRSTVYNLTTNTKEGSFEETFKIESNGDLQFIGNTETDETFNIANVFPTTLAFLGNNKYAYQTGCDYQDPQNTPNAGFKRESSGLLEPLGDVIPIPKAPTGQIYCGTDLAGDTSDHLAMVMVQLPVSGAFGGGNVLASFTADSQGNLTTKSTSENMPSAGANESNVGGMSISPTGKLLVVADDPFGLQLFHFNGGDPITKYTGVITPDDGFAQFGWDKSNHLFALGLQGIRVYAATPTSIKEAPGSPYTIREASSLIVLSLK
jgi:hypothetical protein